MTPGSTLWVAAHIQVLNGIGVEVQHVSGWHHFPRLKEYVSRRTSQSS